MPRMKYTGTPADDSAAQRVGDEGARGRWIVVADPRFEQVAEDVKRVGLLRLLADEAPEQVGMAGRSASRCRSEMNSVVIAPF